MPWNWSGGFHEAIFYFYFIKSFRPYKSSGFLWAAGFYEVKIKIALLNPPDQFYGNVPLPAPLSAIIPLGCPLKERDVPDNFRAFHQFYYLSVISLKTINEC
jgi:hypothetical protein